jgi:FkbM family methyltransferase
VSMKENSFLGQLKRNTVARKLLNPVAKLRATLDGSRGRKLQTALSNLSEMLRENPVLHVREFESDFEMDGRSDLFQRLVKRGYYEPELADVCRKYIDPDASVIDVGANIGFFTVFCAKQLRDGKVLAIEPTERAHGLLTRNIERNSCSDKVLVFKGVAAASSGEIEIKTIPGREEYSSIGAMTHPSIKESVFETERVAMEPIDSLVGRYGLKPALIKIDAEGSEKSVFEGAVGTLKKFKPIVLSELADFLLKENGTSSAEVVELVENCGYRCVEVGDVNQPHAQKPFGEMLCIPSERL